MTALALMCPQWAFAHPYQRALTDLVGELATTSTELRTRWAAHDVRLHQTGSKQFQHPVAVLIDVDFDSLERLADPGLTFTAYRAEPSTPRQTTQG